MNLQASETANRFSDTADKIIRRVGLVTMWANVVVIAAIILQVILRYGFGHGMVLLEELQWHFYAIAFMFGLSYAVMTDSHVGMDLLYDKLKPRTQCYLDIFGLVFLLIPFAALICYQSLPFWYESFRLAEHSAAPLGLPFRWLIKAVIPLSFALLVLSAVSRLLRTISALRRL